MVARDSATPLFAQVRDALRARIGTGELSPGTKLPSEGELEVAFGVSRITVRQALAELNTEGLIEKVNGRGSFVTRPAPPADLGPLTGFYETMRRRGHKAWGKVGPVKSVRADANIAAALGVPPGTPLASLAITRFVDGEPLAHGVSHAGAELIARLAACDLGTVDVITVLNERLGLRLESSQLELGAEAADARLAKRLGLQPGSPVLRLAITSRDFSGTPVVYTDFAARGDRFRYRVAVRR
jgi:GntR family transcriptional regulator